jgi:hypothetical protein
MKVHLFLAFFLILSIVEKLFSQQCFVAHRIRSLGALPERTGYCKPALHKKVADYISENLFSVSYFLADREIIVLPPLITFSYTVNGLTICAFMSCCSVCGKYLLWILLLTVSYDVSKWMFLFVCLK